MPSGAQRSWLIKAQKNLEQLQSKLGDMLGKLKVLSKISFDAKVVLDDSGKVVGFKPSSHPNAYRRAEFPNYPS